MNNICVLHGSSQQIAVTYLMDMGQEFRSMKWKTLRRGGQVEVWIESTRPGSTLLYGVQRSSDEAGRPDEKGMEIFGLDEEIFARYSENTIYPAVEGRNWNLAAVFEVLTLYMDKPDRYAALLALMMGRVHLADQVRNIDAALGGLAVAYIEKLSEKTTKNSNYCSLPGPTIWLMHSSSPPETELPWNAGWKTSKFSTVNHSSLA